MSTAPKGRRDLQRSIAALNRHGHLVIVGTPGSGKTFLGNALLDHFKQHFVGKRISTVSEVEKHLQEGTPSILLMDGTLGEVRVDMQEYKVWRAVLPRLMALTDMRQCLLVVTLYPHLLLELRALEAGSQSPLVEDSCKVSLKDMDEEEKKAVLYDFLSDVDMMQHEKHELVDVVLKNDISGASFPWCCAQLVQRLHNASVDDPSVCFTAPAESYVPLLHRMLMDPTHGEMLTAVMCLTMMGFRSAPYNQEELQKAVAELGLRDVSYQLLETNISFLKNFILSDDCSTFHSLVCHEAVCLALYRLNRLPVLLKICDVEFLVKYTRVCEEPSRSFKHIFICPTNRSHLMDRIITDIINGKLIEILQYLSFQNEQFLNRFEEYILTGRIRARQIVTAKDGEIKLPLLYCSALTGCDWLINWCLDLSMNEGSFRSTLIESALVWAFAQRTKPSETSASHGCKILSVVKELQSQYENRISTVQLPCPNKNRLFSKHCQAVHDLLTSCLELSYLNDLSLSIPASAINKEMRNETVHLEFSTKQVYLALRLLSDTQVDQVDSQGNTLLHLAAEEGDQDVIDVAVKSGASLTARNNMGLTPPQVAQARATGENVNSFSIEGRDIHKTCEDGDILTVKVLLYCGVSVQERDYKNLTPLHSACLGGHADVARLVLELGAEINAVDRDGSTAAHLACHAGHEDVMRLLVERDADVTVTDDSGRTPLHKACSAGRTRCVSFLLQSGADVNRRDNNGKSPLFLACLYGHPDLADLLIERGADVNAGLSCGVTPLHKAATSRSGNVEMVDLLIKHGARVDAADVRSETPLFAVVQARNKLGSKWKDIASLLVQNRADVNVKDADGNCLVHCLFNDGDKESLDWLLDRGADIDVRDAASCTVLHQACKDGKAAAVRWLTQHGATANVRDKLGYTPFHWACVKNHLDVVKNMVSSGDADLDARTEDGETALHLACSHGRTGIAAVLVAANCDINARDNDGCTPLFVSCAQGTNRLRRLLTDRGADVNMANLKGETPLHCACAHGQTAAAAFLLKRGADITTKSVNGDTPANCAQRNGHTETLDLLLGGSVSHLRINR